MPTISRKGTTIQATNITRELLDAVVPIYPLASTVIGVRLLGTHIHQGWSCDSCEYLCILHRSEHIPDEAPEDITLKEAYSEAAFCRVCKTYLAIPPEMPAWDKLRDRLCNHDYGQVEICTGMSKDIGPHMLFNYKRLVPGANEFELLDAYGDYSAKHIMDERRDKWPDAIYVSEKEFEQELAKRQA